MHLGNHIRWTGLTLAPQLAAGIMKRCRKRMRCYIHTLQLNEIPGMLTRALLHRFIMVDICWHSFHTLYLKIAIFHSMEVWGKRAKYSCETHRRWSASASSYEQWWYNISSMTIGQFNLLFWQLYISLIQRSKVIITPAILILNSFQESIYIAMNLI